MPRKIVENYQLQTAEELREFLNNFKKTDLNGVYVQVAGSDYINIGWEEETLSDGSVAHNIIISGGGE